MTDFDLIKSTFREVHRHFLYTYDHDQWEVPERWDSHPDEVERGEIFRGDCEDFALTTVELLLRRGIPKEACRLATCWTELDEYHAVAVVEDERGVGWLIDNRMRTLRPWASVPGYRWHKSMRMDSIQPGKRFGEWRDAS